MKLLLFLLMTILFPLSSFGQLKKDFKEFTILSLPREDKLIGKIKSAGNYSGQPLADEFITTTKSLESYDSLSSSNFKLQILNLLSTNLGIGSNKYKVADLGGLEISDCNDLGKLALANNRTIVVSTVKATELTFTQISGNNVDIKTDVQALLKKVFSTSNVSDLIGGTAEINANSIKVSLKTGKNLVVATRNFRISATNNFFFRNYGNNAVKTMEGNPNAFNLREPEFDSRSIIEYQSTDSLSDFFNTSIEKDKHKGCFVVAYANPAVNNDSGDIVNGKLLFCPRANQVTGEIKLFNTYQPKQTFQSAIPRPIATILTGDKIIAYRFQMVGVNSVTYSSAPNNDADDSNFVLDKASARWELRKFVYKYQRVN